MRTFGPPISPQLNALIRNQVSTLFAAGSEWTEVSGPEAGMDELPGVVFRLADIRFKSGERLRIGRSEEVARPPFEWLYEISSDVGESEYFKHYLVFPGDDTAVLAQRKELTPIDEAEAEIILADLAAATAALADPPPPPRRRRKRGPDGVLR